MIESLRHEFEAFDFRLQNHSLKFALDEALVKIENYQKEIQKENASALQKI